MEIAEAAPGAAEQAEPKKTSGSPSRQYVVLEQVMFEGDQIAYFTEVNRVEARNAQNAMRKAARERENFDGEEAKAILSVVPASMWRPTPVTLSRKAQVSVSIGE